jgi:hypothetical protein
MGVRFIVNSEEEGSDSVAMYDSVTGVAFGPVMPSWEAAQGFVDFLDMDARKYSQVDLMEAWANYCKTEAFANATA